MTILALQFQFLIATAFAADIPVFDLSQMARTPAAPQNTCSTPTYAPATSTSQPASLPSPSPNSLLADAPFQEPAPVPQPSQNPPGFQNQANIAPSTANATSASLNTVEQSSQPSAAGRTLRLYFRELSILRQAALAAGGDLKISILPVGITAEDMIVPLSQMGWFELKPEGNVIVVQSRTDDPYLTQVRTEIGRLERRRSYLLHDLKLLEKMAQTGSQKLPPVPQLVVPQTQAPVLSSVNTPANFSTSANRLPAQNFSAHPDVAATYAAVSSQQNPNARWVEQTPGTLTAAPPQETERAYRLASSFYAAPQTPQNQAASASPATAFHHNQESGQQNQPVQQGPLIETSQRLDPSVASQALQESINPPGALSNGSIEPREVPPTPLN